MLAKVYYSIVTVLLIFPVILSMCFSVEPIGGMYSRLLSIIMFIFIVYLIGFLKINGKIKIILKACLCFTCFLMTFTETVCYYLTGHSFDFSFWAHFNINTLLYGGAKSMLYQCVGIAVAVTFTCIGFMCFFVLIHKQRIMENCKISRLQIVLGIAFVFSLIFLKFPPFVLIKNYYAYLDKKVVTYDKSQAIQAGICTKIVPFESEKSLAGKNLVFIFLESIESTYLDEKLFPGLMPCMKKMLKNEAVFFSNVNQAPNSSFTLSGLFASFTGGILTRFHLLHYNSSAGQMTEHTKGKNNGFNCEFADRLPSFPRILKKAGYYQVFMKGAHIQFSGTNLLLGKEKYDEMLCYKDYFSKIQDRRLYGPWGARDRALFIVAYDKYVQLCKNKKPFNLTLLTVDSHPPDGYPSPHGIKYRDGKKGILNAIHDTDKQLELFINKLKSVEGWENTVVVIASDHLSMRNSVYSTLLKNKNRKMTFFALNSGLHKKIDTPGATFDIAPTVLDLLKVKHNVKFPLGQSLLSQTNPKRLCWDQKKLKLWESYCHKYTSDHVVSNKRGVNINLIPGENPKILVNGYAIPVITFYEGRQKIPDGEVLFVIKLDKNNKYIKSDFILDNRITKERFNNKLYNYIVLGRDCVVSKYIFNHDIPFLIPNDDLTLLYGHHGGWIKKTSNDYDKLAISVK